MKQAETINTTEEFTAQLNKVITTGTGLLFSFYKYCNEFTDEGFKYYKDLILEELSKFGLKPYKVLNDFTMLFKFKGKLEAIIYVNTYGSDLLIYRK